ncbi:putative ribonuclease H-like domain-containing protein [Tanacetum coccineum]
MTKSVTEHGLFSSGQQRINHKDFQNCPFVCFLSQAEPKKVIQALQDPSWIEAMQDELLHFKLQKVWTLVDLPYGKRAIGTKWVYRNKKDDREIMVRNKARMVAQGYTQEEGIDYDEVFALVARIEVIMLFFAYASFMNFIVYQMDVKSAFLYGIIEEEVYVCQPPGFEDPEFSNKVYKVEKALYGLHQAPRAWYETLSTYLLENGFKRGTIDKTLFIKKDKEILDEFYGGAHFLLRVAASTPMKTNKALLKDEEDADVDAHLYRSMIRSLMYITTSRPDIMFAVYACARLRPGNPQQEVVNFLEEDKTVYKEWEDRMERAVTTASSLEAEQDSEAQIKFEAASKQSNDPLLSRFNTLGSGEDSMKLKELIEFCTKLSERALVVKRELMRIKIDDGNAFWNEIEVNTGDSKLIMLGINLLLPVLVYATRHSLTAVRHKLMLPALVDKKKVIITEKSVRSDLMLEDADGTECLPNDEIFEQLTLMGAKTTAWNEFSSTMASAIICLATNKKFNFSMYIFDNMMKNLEGGVKFLMYPRFVQVFLDKQVEGMSKHKGIYVTPSHTKKVFANMNRPGTGFSGKVTPIFQTMMVQAPEYMEPILDKATNEEPISTPSCDPPQSGEDRLQLTELMNLCTKLQKQVLDLEEAKTAQAKEIASLKKRVKQLEQRRKSRTSGLKMLRKVGSASRVESSNDASLGAQKDVSKQGKKIANLDADEEVTLIDETQERNDKEMLFDIQDDLQGEEVVAKKEVAEKEVSAANPVTTAGEVVTTANVEVTTASASTITIDELTLAHTLIEIKAAKPKAVTTAAITTTTTRPKARGVVVQEPSKFKTTSSTSQASQLLQAKDKGKAKMVEPEKH